VRTPHFIATPALNINAPPGLVWPSMPLSPIAQGRARHRTWALIFEPTLGGNAPAPRQVLRHRKRSSGGLPSPK
jgi:hypothetical protein